MLFDPSNPRFNASHGCVCRGAATSFPNDPFRCVFVLREWVVSTVEDRLAIGSFQAAQRWWQEHGEEFLLLHKKARCIVPPNRYLKLESSVVLPLKKDWVRRMEGGNTGAPLPYDPHHVYNTVVRRAKAVARKAVGARS